MTSCQLYPSTCQSWAMQSLKSTPNLWRCTIRVAPATQEWSATTCGVDRESSNGPTVLGMKANIRRMPGMEKVWLMNQLYNFIIYDICITVWQVSQSDSLEMVTVWSANLFIYYIKVLSVHCNVILAEQTSLHNISVKPTMLRSQKNRLSS